MVNCFWLCKPTVVGKELSYKKCAEQHIDSHVVKVKSSVFDKIRLHWKLPNCCITYITPTLSRKIGQNQHPKQRLGPTDTNPTD